MWWNGGGGGGGGGSGGDEGGGGIYLWSPDNLDWRTVMMTLLNRSVTVIIMPRRSMASSKHFFSCINPTNVVQVLPKVTQACLRSGRLRSAINMSLASGRLLMDLLVRRPSR